MSVRMQRMVAVLAASAPLFLGLAAHAAVPHAWKDCEKEVVQFCPKAQSNEAIFQCIEKREGMGAKAGLSKACNTAHERYEAQAGKKESEEHGHQEHHQQGE
ncbi:hypothetical protein [Corallococcus sp. AB011P]|uniref:hypothetical protein n=1 Tax=Corallococcus sp. AB011P TaxID=2316735 RepID=UPI0011C3C677|nr:hypothetical protein [Corallococcus sp. AB011P]